MNRMLSQFSYDLFGRLMKSKGFQAGIEVKEVNPAFTSLIGDVKFGHGYGLSTHQAAAMAIARRLQGFCERIRMKTQVRSRLPENFRNRRRHVWSDWARLSKLAKRERKERLSFNLVSRQRLDRTRSGKTSSWALFKSSPTRTRKGLWESGYIPLGLDNPSGENISWCNS